MCDYKTSVPKFWERLSEQDDKKESQRYNKSGANFFRGDLQEQVSVVAVRDCATSQGLDRL
jgi:hypothetical protein